MGEYLVAVRVVKWIAKDGRGHHADMARVSLLPKHHRGYGLVLAANAVVAQPSGDRGEMGQNLRSIDLERLPEGDRVAA
jgi:hypothetical protein